MNTITEYLTPGLLSELSFKLRKKVSKSLSFRLKNISKQLDLFYLHGCLKKAGVPNANTIFTYTNSRELQALFTLAAACPYGAVALEIGSYLGASSYYLAAGLAQVNGHFFCVDTWYNETMPEGERDTFADFEKNTSGVSHSITSIRKRSDQISDLDISSPLNLVFIDGDHSYAAVKSDFNCVQSRLAPNGIIAFHDYNVPIFEGVSRLVGEVLASSKWVVAGRVDNLLWIKPAVWSD